MALVSSATRTELANKQTDPRQHRSRDQAQQSSCGGATNSAHSILQPIRPQTPPSPASRGRGASGTVIQAPARGRAPDASRWGPKSGSPRSLHLRAPSERRPGFSFALITAAGSPAAAGAAPGGPRRLAGRRLTGLARKRHAFMHFPGRHVGWLLSGVSKVLWSCELLCNAENGA